MEILEFLKENWEMVFLMASVVLAPTGVFAWLSKMLGKLIETKVDNNKFQEVLLIVNELVWTTVDSANQTMADNYKKKNKNGKLTAGQKEEIKEAVLDSVKEQLKEEGKEVLERYVGDIEEYISNKIESAVRSSGK